MDAHGLETLLAVALVAALAPIIVTAVPALRIPQVVVLIVAGILIGPHGLGLADTPGIKLLSNVGLGFLFLLAGYDFDPALLRQHAGRLAIAGWAMSCVIAVAAVASLGATGFVRDFVPIGLALTTTALGIVAPILRDNAMVSGQFGRYVMAAGAVGELFPIIAISLFLSRRGEFVAIASILAVCLAAILLSVLPRIIGDARLRALIRQGRRATAQTTLRWSIVLLLLLLVAAGRFGLDVVLGAMLAGMVLRTWTRRMGVDDAPLEDKLDAVGYGFFIPVFFVVSGMTLAIGAILADPLRLLAFFVLLLVVRGLPSLLVYRRSMPLRQRVEMTFITATTMPLLVALAEIGLSDGVMLPANAAALVGAGVMSVLIFPAIAVVVGWRGRESPVNQPAEPPEAARPESGPPEIGLVRFPEAGDALADADAHGRSRPPAAPSPQLVQQRGGDPGAGAAERVTDGDRATVDVDQFAVAAELIDDRDRLRRERLIDLEQLQIADLPARPGKRPGHRRDRADAHVVGMHPGGRRSGIPGQRLGAGCQHGPLRHQQQPGGAIVETRGVPAGDRAALPERWRSAGQLGRGQVGSDPFVLGHCSVWCLHGDDLRPEQPGIAGACRPQVAAQRKLVLASPVHPVSLSDVLRGLP